MNLPPVDCVGERELKWSLPAQSPSESIAVLPAHSQPNSREVQGAPHDGAVLGKAKEQGTKAAAKPPVVVGVLHFASWKLVNGQVEAVDKAQHWIIPAKCAIS